MSNFDKALSLLSCDVNQSIMYYWREKKTDRWGRLYCISSIGCWLNFDTYRYISKNLNIMKKVNIFCHSFQKVKPIYNIDSLHRVKYFKPLFLEILMILILMILTQCLRKLEYYIRSIKQGYFQHKCQASEKFISMHSILGWTSFCMNYCINAASHGGD